MSKHKKGHKSAGTANKTKNSLVKVVVKSDDVGEWIKPKTLDKFYIDEEAIFPSIVFEIKTEKPGPYKWSWVITWDGHVSGLHEKARGKKTKTFSAKGSFTQKEKSWDANCIERVYGGRLAVTVDAGDEKFKRTVLVTAKPPAIEKIKAYLVKNDATALQKLLAQESQFKHVINLDGEPVVAADNGYGVAQLTHPAPTYSQVWSWKENIDAAILLINDKKRIAKTWLKGHGKFDQDMLDTETISLWNGGHYYEWKPKPEPGSWVRNSKILCDTKTGNMGWDMSLEQNKGKTEDELHERDNAEYRKGGKGQTATHPWKYTGVCYADHILGK